MSHVSKEMETINNENMNRCEKTAKMDKLPYIVIMYQKADVLSIYPVVRGINTQKSCILF